MQGRVTPVSTDRAFCAQPPMPLPRRSCASRITIRVPPSLQHVAPSAAPVHYRSFLKSPQSPVLCHCQCPSLTKVPFLRRHYPASSVLRAFPPPHSALSDRHRPRVSRHDRPGYRASRVARVSLLCMLSPLPRRSVCLLLSLTSPDITAFPVWVGGPACAMSFSRSARRSLTLRPHTRQVTKCDPLHQRLQPLRYLHHCSNCYRLEGKLPGETLTQ